MSRDGALCRHWLRWASAGLLPLILAVSLAGCGQQPVPTHTFAGKVQVISVPTPYQIPMSIALTIALETAVQAWDADQPGSARLSLEQATTFAQQTTYL